MAKCRSMTEEQAMQELGLTRRVWAECDRHDGEYLVSPDADLDGEVLALDVDDGRTATLNGWLWSFTDVEVMR